MLFRPGERKHFKVCARRFPVEGWARLAGICDLLQDSFKELHETLCRLRAIQEPASQYPTWNSTVVSIEGSISPGQTITLKSKLDPKRTFKLKVKEFEPTNKL